MHLHTVLGLLTFAPGTIATSPEELPDPPKVPSLVARISEFLDDIPVPHLHINPSFLGFDPEQDARIVGRADVAKVLPNNVPQRLTIAASATVGLMFEVSTTSMVTTEGAAATSTAVVAKREAGSSAAEVGKREADESKKENDDWEFNQLWDDDGTLRNVKRDSKTVYITANTCIQPSADNNNVTSAPPQLTLYVSKNASNKSPGPDNTNDTEAIPFTQGAVMYTGTVDSLVYFTVASGNLTNHTGTWTFEIAASTDTYYHRYVENEERLYWVDSDSAAALLTTGNLTTSLNETLIDEVMSSTPPYAVMVDTEEKSTIEGVRYSYCGLQNYASVASVKNGDDTNTVKITMTTRSGGHPKEQFYVGNLTSKTRYVAIPVQIAEIVGNETQEYTAASATTTPDRRRAVNNNTAGGGGTVYAGTAFDTKEGFTCRIITSLGFCNDTEYAVPSNVDRFPDISELANYYDNYARNKYALFEKALAQTACDASPAGMYSLARTCDDCRKAYKQWLCSVVIPRCEDYDNAASDGHVRNANTSFPNGTMLPEDIIANLSGHTHAPAYLYARNQEINDAVAPGPYREILPCDDLCYDIVQSCPAALGFDCPLRGTPQYESSYAQKNNSKTLACNFPGALHQASGAEKLGAWGWMWVIIAGELMGIML